MAGVNVISLGKDHKQRVRVTIDGADSVLNMLRLAPNELAKAERMAVNKTVTGARTDITTMVRKDIGLNIKLKDLRKRIHVTKASKSGPARGELRIKGSAIPLADFSPRPSKPGTKRLAGGGYSPKGGRSVEVFKGKRRVLEGSFLAKGRKSGRLGMFQRVGDERYPIRQMYGPKPETLIQQGDNMESLRSRIGARLKMNHDHEIKRALERAKAGAGK